MESFTKKIIERIGSTASLVVHTLLFMGAFTLPLFGVPIDRVLLVLTTIVSLEAIYLALFIQMSVNRAAESIEEVEEDIEEIQKEIDDIAEDIEVEEARDETHDEQTDVILGNIQRDITKLLEDIERLKKGK